MVAALAVFLGTYFLIAARRFRLLHIGRPAGALLGAVSMVLFGVLTPEEAFAAVDLPTLGLLFGMMVLSVYLDEAGFFGALAAATLRRSSSPGTLLGAVVWVSGISSAFLLNDTVCLVMTPILVTLVIALRLDPLPSLLALATSANIGSATTLAGNPQAHARQNPSRPGGGGGRLAPRCRSRFGGGGGSGPGDPAQPILA